MAVMWPRQLPPDVLANPLRATECDVYRRLEVELDHSWWVFYSRPWLGVTPTGEEIDGECDFVVAHAEHGMLCIEVKGGEVSCNPLTAQWTSRDRWQVTHNIKDPVEQARRSKHELLNQLKESPACRNRWLRVRHGVVLPHSARPPHDLGPDRPLFLFCFAEQYRQSLSDWVMSRFRVAQEELVEEGLGLAGMEALRNLLALPVSLKTPLGHLLHDEDCQIEYLTQQQFHLLTAIEDLPRVCIQGGAGTGKTVLASQLALKLAHESGLRTLFVCYNEPLARGLGRQLEDRSGMLTVASFHSYCFRVLNDAGVRIDEGQDRSKLFETDLPEAVVSAAELDRVTRFDAIIVDEGQDFRELWWIALEALLRPDGPSLLRVFFDSNQTFYGDGKILLKAMDAAPIRLSWNLRNTQAIHETAYRHYAGRPVTCNGPAGAAPEAVRLSEETEVRSAVGQVISRLIARESVDPEDIAVLVSQEAWIGRLAPEGLIAGVAVVNAADRSPACVVLDTVRRFKGLEARVVIVVADSALTANPELCYVTLSRARTRIFVVGLDSSIRSLLRMP